MPFEVPKECYLLSKVTIWLERSLSGYKHGLHLERTSAGSQHTCQVTTGGNSSSSRFTPLLASESHLHTCMHTYNSSIHMLTHTYTNKSMVNRRTAERQEDGRPGF